MMTLHCLLLAAFGYYLVSVVGVTAGAHRLWSHRTYKARLPLRLFLIIADTMAFQVRGWLTSCFSTHPSNGLGAKQRGLVPAEEPLWQLWHFPFLSSMSLQMQAQLEVCKAGGLLWVPGRREKGRDCFNLDAEVPVLAHRLFSSFIIRTKQQSQWLFWCSRQTMP